MMIDACLHCALLSLRAFAWNMETIFTFHAFTFPVLFPQMTLVVLSPDDAVVLLVHHRRVTHVVLHLGVNRPLSTVTLAILVAGWCDVMTYSLSM